MMNIEGCVGLGQRALVEMPLVAKPLSNTRWWRESGERRSKDCDPILKRPVTVSRRPAGLEEV